MVQIATQLGSSRHILIQADLRTVIVKSTIAMLEHNVGKKTAAFDLVCSVQLRVQVVTGKAAEAAGLTFHSPVVSLPAWKVKKLHALPTG